MEKDDLQLVSEDSSIASSRKQDHIALAFESGKMNSAHDARFHYEPILSAHPTSYPQTAFLRFNFDLPLWVSSMTGGTEKASLINKNLAKACGEFGMGMGLGSCRSLLYDDKYLADFAVKKHMPNQPLFANLGIAQIEEIAKLHDWNIISNLISKLDADGLIIHVNPLQEWLQSEGDTISYPPIDTIKKTLDRIQIPVIVKEVGQGFGPKSLEALMNLPLAAIEFGAFGGTNFSYLELMRNQNAQELTPLANVGQRAEEMVDSVNKLLTKHNEYQCTEFIVSGGVSNFLDGYFLINKIKTKAIYGQASKMLKYALDGYDSLQNFISKQKEGLSMAKAFLTIREDERK